MELKRSERNFPLRKEVYEDRYPLLKKDLFVLCQIYFTSDRPPPDSMRQSVRSTIYKRYRDASEMFSIFNPDEPDSIEPS
jgi:hypothetical protein